MSLHSWLPRHGACPVAGPRVGRDVSSVMRPCSATSQVSLLSLCPMSLENTSYQDLSGHQGGSGAPGDPSAQWPAVKPAGPAWPSAQQPLPFQPGSYPAGGDLGQPAVPVPLYAVPETHLPGTRGSVAVTEAPGGRTWEETQQTYLPPGKACAGLAAGARRSGGRSAWGVAGTSGSWQGPDWGRAQPWCWCSAHTWGIALSLPLSSLWGKHGQTNCSPSCPRLGPHRF